MDIKYLYESTELPLAAIANKLGIPYKRVWTYVKKNYSSSHRKARKATSYRKSKLGKNNPMFGKKGEHHHNYIGVISDNKGYLMVLKPDWYSGRKSSKHVFLHHVVYCSHFKMTEIPRGYCIHHIDHNPYNNDIDNLQLMTLSEHTKLHASERATTKP